MLTNMTVIQMYKDIPVVMAVACFAKKLKQIATFFSFIPNTRHFYMLARVVALCVLG